MQLRFGTWNCRQGLDRKRVAIDELACDVLVVQECARTPALATEVGVSFVWRGHSNVKGLGVFGFGGWTITPVVEAEPFDWCLPVTATSPDGEHKLLVLAVWTVKSSGDGRPSYEAQFGAVLDRWGSEFADGRVIIAGDFNASMQMEGANRKRHRTNLDRVELAGGRSVVHHHYGIEHGSDDEPRTLRRIGRGRISSHFGVDYVFVSSCLVQSLGSGEVGERSTWIESGRSDHCPVTVDLELAGSVDER
jgi:hypothetical protein